MQVYRNESVSLDPSPGIETIFNRLLRLVFKTYLPVFYGFYAKPAPWGIFDREER